MTAVDLDRVRDAMARAGRGIGPSDASLASVALVVDDALDILLIRRAEFAGDPWSGHLALPGGRVEPTDADRGHTAVRETMEEVGLDLRRADRLGTLDDVGSPKVGRRQVVVRPFVFHVPQVPALRPNREVAAVHRVGLDRLLRGECRGSFELTWRGRQITLPSVDVDGRRLWGMTLRVIDDLLHRLDGRGHGLDRLPDRRHDRAPDAPRV